MIGEIDQIGMAIASAIEEQGTATTEISRSIQEAARGTMEVNANISGVQQAADQTGAAASQVLGAARTIVLSVKDLRARSTASSAGACGLIRSLHSRWGKPADPLGD